MTIQRWDPFREMWTLRDAMNKLFEDSFVRPSSLAGGTYGMAVDLSETGDEYSVKASLPGFAPEEINVTATGATLTIQAEHKEETEKQQENYILRERHRGSFMRTITLPTRVDTDNAHARFENGELILTLPKAADVKPKQLKVTAHGGQQLTEGADMTQMPHEGDVQTIEAQSGEQH